MVDILVRPDGGTASAPDLALNRDASEADVFLRPFVTDTTTDLALFVNPKSLQSAVTPPGYRLKADGSVFGLTGLANRLRPSMSAAVGSGALLRDFAGTATASQWTDAQGIGNATQASTTRQPAVTTISPSGNTAVSFVADAGVGDDPDWFNAAAAGASATYSKTLLYACIKTTQVTPDFAIFFSMGTSNRFFLYLTPDGKFHADSFADTATSVSLYPINNNQWTRLIVVIDDTGSVVRQYVNGVLQPQFVTGSGTNSINLGTDFLSIGANLADDTFPFVGQLSRLGVAQSNTAFSTSQIAAVDEVLRNWIEDAGAASYSLSCSTGAFTETGNAAGLTKQSVVSAVQGSFALTGNATNLSHGYAMAATQGAFTLTGNAAGLTKQSRVTAALGTFTETGNAAGLTAQRKLTAAQGSFVLTGVAANLQKGFGLITTQGTFSLTGITTGLTKQSRVTAAQGAFTETGNATGLTKQSKVAAAQGTFVLTGNAAGLTKQSKVTAAQGSFVLTGIAAGLTAQRKLTANQGVFTLTGNDATLTFGGAAGSYSLVANAGAFTLSGIATGLTKQSKIAAALGTFAETGNAAGLYRGLRLTAAQGAFTLTGTTTGLTAQRRLPLTVGTFVETGNAANLQRGRYLSASSGSFALTGQPVAIRYNRIFQVSPGVFVLEGFEIDFDLSQAVPAPAIAPSLEPSWGVNPFEAHESGERSSVASPIVVPSVLITSKRGRLL